MTPTTAGSPGDQLAVVSQTGPTVTFFDAATHERLGVLEVPPQPHELCFDPDHRLLYCASTYRSGFYHLNEGRAHEITVIDVDTRTIVATLDTTPDHAPHGLALDRARARLYVSVEATDTEPGGVLIIDTRTHARLGRISTLAPGPHWFALTPDGRHGYTTNKEAPFVSVVDLDRGVLTDRIPVPGSEGLTLAPDGRHLYVATPKADFATPPTTPPSIHVIDTATHETVRTLPTKGQVMPVHATSTGMLLAGELRPDTAPGGPLGAQLPGVLTVFAPDTLALVGEVEVGQFPLTITSSPDARLAYVSGNLSSTVTVVDLQTLRPVTTLEVDRTDISGAHGLAYIASPHS
ncbi:YncE family protein [Streptomyces chattanoogensis]|uniref:Surface layer protein n=1 Tax=Streptomyces chattanoogensis TaxID=66876 RepID=A0A0N0XVZ7_9ACTN|nr:surface layer protein [Streptomyces chattanoogensis]KPC63394.1 surface layer protein [Streptomyces chattanoogensis]